MPQDGKPEQGKLFESSEEVKPRAQAGKKRGRPRVMRAERYQVRMLHTTVDALLPKEHQVREVWKFVEGLDLEELYERIEAVEQEAGRPAIDPKILMGLWLYATVEGIGSARALERLCEEHIAYQWLCGGVSVNYHTLSDFRTGNRALLDRLLTQSVAMLDHCGVVELDRLAQDGMRVRASAGASSFRRAKSLQECLKEARHRVEQLRRDIDVNPAIVSKRQLAARERASRERGERIARALEALKTLQESQEASQEDEQSPADSQAVGPGEQADASTKEKKKEPRASSSDPEARVMKMPDGGFRPAFNVQFATATEGQVIVAVDVTNSGSDYGQMPPMMEQIHERYGEYPHEYLVDGGFVRKEDINQVSSPEIGCTVYAPVRTSKKAVSDPHKPRPNESPTVGEWRVRMGTPEAKTIYKLRAATAECVNAIARNRGLRQFLVRGLEKVKSVALWYALAHNMMRTLALSPAMGR